MRIQKSELAQKIGKIKSVVPKKGNNPVLQGVLCKDGYLAANNMQIMVKVKLEDMGEDAFVIPAKAFDLICSLPDGEVEIIPEDNDMIMVKAEKIRNRYHTVNPMMFPATGFLEEGENNVTINSSLLLESIRRVLYAIPTTYPNPALTAMLLSAAGGSLNFVGTDSHVLAWDKVTYDGEFKLLIPKAAAEKIQSIGLTGEVSIKHNATSAAFITDEYEIHTRIMGSDYIKYQALFKELPMHTITERAGLLDAVARARMCTDGRSVVKFRISGETLNINCKDSSTDYNEMVLLQEPFEQDLIIGIDAELVIETLKAFDCKNIRLRFAGAKQPMFVEAEDSDFKALILPVVIQEDK